MNKINDSINKIENTVGAFALGILVILVFVAAALRYLGNPIVWSVDLAQLLFVWVVFLGADRALQTNNHIGVDFFVNFLPKKIKKFIYIIHYLIILLFLSGIIYYGFDLTIRNVSRNFNTLGISYSYATAGVPIGCLLMFRTIIYKFISNEILSSETEQKDLI